MPRLRGEQLGPRVAPRRLQCRYNWWQTSEGRAFVKAGVPLARLEAMLDAWEKPLKQRLRRNPQQTQKGIELDRERAIKAQRKAAAAQRRLASSQSA